MNDTAVCTVCHQDLREAELGRHACALCERRTDENLRLLAGPDGLYARLDETLTPGPGGGGPAISRGSSSRPPLRLHTLNLMTERGPILGALETWVRDWETYGRADMCEAGTLQQRLDHAVATLRFNLAWAVGAHPAFDEFAREVRLIRRRCETPVAGGPRERSVAVACPCGRKLWITLTSEERRCDCGAQYGWEELRGLPLAERRAA